MSFAADVFRTAKADRPLQEKVRAFNEVLFSAGVDDHFVFLTPDKSQALLTFVDSAGDVKETTFDVSQSLDALTEAVLDLL